MRELLGSEKTNLEIWENTIIKDNGGVKPEISDKLTTFDQGSQAAYELVRNILSNTLDSKAASYQIIHKTLISTINSLLKSANSTSGLHQEGYFLSSTGKAVIKLYYYLRTYKVEAKYIY